MTTPEALTRTAVALVAHQVRVEPTAPFPSMVILASGSVGPVPSPSWVETTEYLLDDVDGSRTIVWSAPIGRVGRVEQRIDDTVAGRRQVYAAVFHGLNGHETFSENLDPFHANVDHDASHVRALAAAFGAAADLVDLANAEAARLFGGVS